MLSISYGFVAFTYLYSSHYVCELRIRPGIDDVTKVEVVLHNMLGNSDTKVGPHQRAASPSRQSAVTVGIWRAPRAQVFNLSSLECSDARLMINEWGPTRPYALAFIPSVERSAEPWAGGPPGTSGFTGRLPHSST